jgi:glycerol-3-phosphate dehydrogenase
VIRDLPRLADREFDLLVIGGGISGLTIAYDAAQRGLSTALVERGDFGAATSFNHLKTIHGGLRYLQSADLRRMRESIYERRTFARIAPRFVAPLAFAMPTAPSLTRNAIAMITAFALDALVGKDRNAGVSPGHRIPPGRIIRGADCRELFDGAISGVTSAAVWHDYETVRSEQLTFAFAEAAAKHGAALANYVEAAAPLQRARTADAAAVVRVADKITGNAFDVRARTVVNAAGPWTAGLAGGTNVGGPMLKAMNLVTSRPARTAALVAPSRAGRALILLPWQGRTLVGTSESSEERFADDQLARSTEVDAFVGEINHAFPALGLKLSEITLVHRGIVPAELRNGRLTLLGQSRLVEHGGSGAPECLAVFGVKYTTARAVAQRAVDMVFAKLGKSAVGCRTAETVLPGAGLDDRDPLDPVTHAIQNQMAQSLGDVVVRRTGAGVLGYPGDGVVTDMANRMQSALGWTDERKHAEIQALKTFYDIV